MLKLEKVKFIIIHHTQRNNDWPAFVRFRHLYIRGWEEIGYHWLIGNSRPFTIDGKIYAGRPEIFQGAHAFGYNRNSLGVCLIGNFNKTIPSQNQFCSLYKLLRQKMVQYNISSANVFGHSELPNVNKTCPGNNIDMSIVRGMLSQ